MKDEQYDENLFTVSSRRKKLEFGLSRPNPLDYYAANDQDDDNESEIQVRQQVKSEPVEDDDSMPQTHSEAEVDAEPETSHTTTAKSRFGKTSRALSSAPNCGSALVKRRVKRPARDTDDDLGLSAHDLHLAQQLHLFLRVNGQRLVPNVQLKSTLARIVEIHPLPKGLAYPPQWLTHLVIRKEAIRNVELAIAHLYHATAPPKSSTRRPSDDPSSARGTVARPASEQIIEISDTSEPDTTEHAEANSNRAAKRRRLREGEDTATRTEQEDLELQMEEHKLKMEGNAVRMERNALELRRLELKRKWLAQKKRSGRE